MLLKKYVDSIRFFHLNEKRRNEMKRLMMITARPLAGVAWKKAGYPVEK